MHHTTTAGDFKTLDDPPTFDMLGQTNTSLLSKRNACLMLKEVVKAFSLHPSLQKGGGMHRAAMHHLQERNDCMLGG